MSEVKFDKVYYLQQKAVVTIGNGELQITTSKDVKDVIKNGDIHYSEYVRSGEKYTLQLFGAEKFYSIASFTPEDKRTLFTALKNEIDVEPVEMDICITGDNFGDLVFTENGFELKTGDEKQILQVPFPTISTVQANKNAGFMITLHSNPKADGVVLEKMRFTVPTNEPQYSIPECVDKISQKINQGAGTEEYFYQINELDLRHPSGKADFRFCKDLLYIQFDSVGIKVNYSSISLIHRLQIPDSKNYYIVMTLTNPIMKGSSKYNHIVVEANEEDIPTILNMPDSQLNEVQAIMQFLNQIGEKKEVEHEGFFKSAHDANAVSGHYKSSDAYLYMTNKYFLILPKCKIIDYNNVQRVEFTRISDNVRKNRYFDFTITESSASKKNNSGKTEFVNIPSEEFGPMLEFVEKHPKLHLTNKHQAREFARGAKLSADREVRQSRIDADNKIHQENLMLGSTSDEDEEEDADFDPNKKPSSDEDDAEEEEEAENTDESEDNGEKEEEGDDKKDDE